jgi:dimethylaniline monooxygenase (N-oxide forming)
VFDTFWTQSPSRTTAFADAPLELPEGATKIYDTFAAKYVNQYIDGYVKGHVYEAKSLLDRVRLSTEVLKIRKEPHGWVLGLKGSSEYELSCSRLAIASGLTSRPNMPKFPTDPQWTAPILHHRDFGLQSKTMLLPDSPYTHCTIIGGGKSAADMVYACGKANKQVNWIVRRSGDGAGYFLHSKPVGRYRNGAEASLTVNATKFNPSPFKAMLPDLLSMHSSVEGRKALNSRFSAMDQGFKAWANYQGRENALENFRQLEPGYS